METATEERGSEVRLLPPMLDVLEKNDRFSNINYSFSELGPGEIGKLVNFGLNPRKTLLLVGEIIQECNILPDCKVKFKGSFSTKEEKKKEEKKKKRKRKGSKLFTEHR